MRCGGGSGAEPASVRPSVRASAPPSSFAPPLLYQKHFKRSKLFKINGLRPFWGAHLRAFVYEHLRKHAPMQRSVHFDICPFGTRACYTGSKKRLKQFKINGLDCFREACFEGPIWTIQIAKSFPCSVVLIFFSSPKRSYAAWRAFAIFDVPGGAPCWAQRARQKRYEMNGLLMIFHMKGTLGAATKYIPKINISKIHPEKQCFVRLPWELFGIHLG